MPARSILLALLLSSAPLACWGDDPGPLGTGDDGPSIPPVGHAWVVFGADTVTAEIAETEEARQRGLMERQSLAEGSGMLFVWTEEEPRSFWMKNTYIPLDVAFLDRNQTIINVRQMEPQTEDLHHSEGPAMFALETPRGWLSAREIGAGGRADIVFGPR